MAQKSPLGRSRGQLRRPWSLFWLPQVQFWTARAPNLNKNTFSGMPVPLKLCKACCKTRMNHKSQHLGVPGDVCTPLEPLLAAPDAIVDHQSCQFEQECLQIATVGSILGCQNRPKHMVQHSLTTLTLPTLELRRSKWRTSRYRPAHRRYTIVRIQHRQCR